jgi:dTDP-4-dehydrorhamnose reductase
MVFCGRDAFDLAQDADFDRLFSAVSPTAVINAAAYTAVDRAESDAAAAFALNRDAPARIARACANRGLPLVHFSTDFVFDGTKAEPYREDDLRNPLNVYGRSKAEGEDAVAAAGGIHAVLRTSWVYSSVGSNFVRTMLRLAAEKQEVRVVDDQIGRPTSARDCADAALLAVRQMLRGESLGLVHVAGEGEASWAELAEEIFRHEARAGRGRPVLKPISTAEYGSVAARPANSRLNTGRAAEILGWQAPSWRYSLAACLAEIERGS